MHQNMTPVDQYRHQIGRQESKKLLKRETKQRKRKESERVQKSGAVGYVCKILVILLLILAALYLAAYLIAQSGDKENSILTAFPIMRPVVEYLGNLYRQWTKPPMLPS